MELRKCLGKNLMRPLAVRTVWGDQSMRAGALVGIVGALALFGCATSAPREQASPAAQHLIELSQGLLDAVTAGDKAVFVATLAEDGVFIDEGATVRTRAELIEQIGPLPPGYVGRLEMHNALTRVVGDAGVVSFDITETLDLYGQLLTTRYHTTDTYQRDGGEWRLIAEQTSVLPSELTPMSADPAHYDDYAGTYALAADVRAQVVRDGEHLYMQREGRARGIAPHWRRSLHPRRPRAGRALFPSRPRWPC